MPMLFVAATIRVSSRGVMLDSVVLEIWDMADSREHLTKGTWKYENETEDEGRKETSGGGNIGRGREDAFTGSPGPRG